MVINFSKTRFNRFVDVNKNNKYIKLIEEAFNYAIKTLKVPCKDLEVNVAFMSKNIIREYNNEFRNNNTVTDVLSFPRLLKPGVENMQLIADKITKENYKTNINRENDCIVLGDILICNKVVFKQAKEYGNTKNREMVYMAVHGLLHLLGYDHMLEEDKKVMRKVEEKIMKYVNLERK